MDENASFTRGIFSSATMESMYLFSQKLRIKLLDCVVHILLRKIFALGLITDVFWI